MTRESETVEAAKPRTMTAAESSHLHVANSFTMLAALRLGDSEQSNLENKYKKVGRVPVVDQITCRKPRFGLVGPGHEMICNYSPDPRLAPQLPHW